MIHWKREGHLLKQGLNIYHPSEWRYSRGGSLRIGKRQFRFRYSVHLHKWSFSYERISPATLSFDEVK